MSVWNKQNWIKDILSKSGTEITEINEDKSEGLQISLYLWFVLFHLNTLTNVKKKPCSFRLEVIMKGFFGH